MPIIDAPSSDTFEITVLGRGYGESTLIHAFDGDWIVIDSLKNIAQGCAPAQYLNDAGVPLEAVQVILATHWHDDHVAGISDLYEHATNAELYIALPKAEKEFNAYIAGASGIATGQVSSGISELTKLLQIKTSQGRAPVRHCQMAQTLFRKAVSGGEVVLTALSPSYADVEAFLQNLSNNSTPSAFARRVTAFKPNDISVATWLSWAGKNALLGADLEQIAAPNRGWNAVMASSEWPRAIAEYLKVPHHGSQTGHSDEVWSELLSADPLAVIAPWNRSRGLPRTSDVRRLEAATPNGFVTTQSPFRKHDLKPGIATALQHAGIKINSTPRQVGIVRARWHPANDNVTIDLFDGASKLSQFVARDS